MANIDIAKLKQLLHATDFTMGQANEDRAAKARLELLHFMPDLLEEYERVMLKRFDDRQTYQKDVDEFVQFRRTIRSDLYSFWPNNPSVSNNEISQAIYRAIAELKEAKAENDSNAIAIDLIKQSSRSREKKTDLLERAWRRNKRERDELLAAMREAREVYYSIARSTLLQNDIDRARSANELLKRMNVEPQERGSFHFEAEPQPKLDGGS